MSNEIKLNRNPVDQGIAELETSIQALNNTFAKEIDGENQLEMVNMLNEIKQEYDTLLTQFESLFMDNIQSTEKAVTQLQETERRLASGIQLMK